MKKVVILGSTNVELVVSSTCFPKKGETIMGNLFNVFNGALAAFIAQEINLVNALIKANSAAGIPIGKIGEQSAMPTLEEVKQYEEA